MKQINSGNMRIAVCDTSTGDVDILLLDKKAEKAFDGYENSSDFFTDLGYDIDYITWLVIDGCIVEKKLTASKSSKPKFVE